jgi:hypothetical protein
VKQKDTAIKIPGRIILSRKGWDTKAGGKPSPILPDGTLGMIPIPDKDSGVRYRDLQFANGMGMAMAVERLTRGRIQSGVEVHLDPDIRSGMVRRRRKFTPAFGQCGASQTHLENQGVRGPVIASCGDLFLFFGLYRPVDDEWSYLRGAPSVHVIFGWLQIARTIAVKDGVPSGLDQHPHTLRSDSVRNELGNRREDNNTLYVAQDQLSFLPSRPGAGMFNRPFGQSLDDPRRLSKKDQRQCSLWSLPEFFCTLSNMGSQPAAKDGVWYPQRRGPGQEFVFNTAGQERQVGPWLQSLFAYAQE